MATFGKKRAGAEQAPRFGKRPAATTSAGVFGNPAHPKGDLSPEARAFLEAERSMRNQAAPAAPSSIPMPSYASPKSGQTQSKSAGKPVFGRRVVARIFDELFVLIAVGIIFMPSLTSAISALASSDVGSPEEARANIEILKFGAVCFLAQALYGILLESSGMQATIGKLMFGAVVTDTNGQKPTLGAVIMRNTLGRLVVNMIPFGGGYAVGLFRGDRRCLHDLIGNTMVRARAPQAESSYSQVFA
ncbi:MAG: RDD family protein [Hyphomonas sp.]|uniref:RDD family protein n=1 Tax=Hyphomonas sp. TaxID=87 RepID=UPI0030019333